MFEHDFDKVCKQKKHSEAEVRDEIICLTREIMAAGLIPMGKERVIDESELKTDIQKSIIPEIMYLDLKSLSAMKTAVEKHIEAERAEEQAAGQPDYLKFIEDNIMTMIQVHSDRSER
jgi:hypothetical protein